MTAKQRKDEARENLWNKMLGYSMGNRTFDEAEVAIDELIAACVAEALEPREQSPELAAIEARLRACKPDAVERAGIASCSTGLAITSVEAFIIAAELDRLRAENARLNGKAAT